MNKCTVKQMCTKCMAQNADNQNYWCWLRCCLNVSSESASATSCGRAFHAGMVRGRNAYLNASTTGWKRWNCMVWPLVVFCRRGAGWYSCGTSTSLFVILYIMVSLLWSLRVCRGSHPRSDTIADTEMSFAASKGNVFHKSSCSALSHFQLINIFLLMWVPDAGTVFQLGTDDSFVSLLWPPYVIGGSLYFCPVISIFLSIFFFLA